MAGAPVEGAVVSEGSQEVAAGAPTAEQSRVEQAPPGEPEEQEAFDRQHLDIKVVTEQFSTRIKEHIRGTLTRVGGGMLDSAKRQVDLAREAGRKGNPSAFTDAVKSDPRPLILLAVALAATLMAARRISNGREE